MPSQEKMLYIKKLVFLLMKGLLKLAYCVEVGNNLSHQVCCSGTRNWFIFMALLSRWEKNWPVVFMKRPLKKIKYSNRSLKRGRERRS